MIVVSSFWDKKFLKTLLNCGQIVLVSLSLSIGNMLIFILKVSIWKVKCLFSYDISWVEYFFFLYGFNFLLFSFTSFIISNIRLSTFSSIICLSGDKSSFLSKNNDLVKMSSFEPKSPLHWFYVSSDSSVLGWSYSLKYIITNGLSTNNRCDYFGFLGTRYS